MKICQSSSGCGDDRAFRRLFAGAGFMCLLLFAVLSDAAVVAVDAEVLDDEGVDAMVVPEASNKDHVPSFIVSKQDHVFAEGSDDILETHLNDMAVITTDQLMTKMDSLTPKEKLDIMDSLKGSMITMDAQFDRIDWTKDPARLEGLRNITLIGRNYTHKAVKVVEDAIAAMWSIFSTDEDKDDESSPGFRGELARRQRRLEEDQDKNDYKKDNKDRRDSYHRHEDRKQRNKFKKRFSEHFHHGGEGFHRFANSHHARKLDEFSEAIYNGDIHAAFSHFATSHSEIQMSSVPDKARRLAENRARRLDKWEQCNLLADCAIAMSVYDMFVYFYSDDIDGATGQVDDNIIKFIEADIEHKASKIKAEANNVKANSASNPTCDTLLREFHRTIEWGDVPEWEGASVNQVCLAEGSQTFVKYGEIAKALINYKFDNGYSSTAETEWINKVDKSLNLVAEKIAVEPLRCAEELFYKRPNATADAQEFPFGGCGGVDTATCPIQNYQFPIEMDYFSTTVEKYEATRDIVKCPTDTAIAQDKCAAAGLSLGASLHNGALITGTWSHAPCGCFIGTNGFVHWSTRTTGCQNLDNGIYYIFPVVCKEDDKTRDDYELVPFQPQCDSGYGISSKDECAKAAVKAGGTLFSYAVHEYNGDGVPCGCFLEGGPVDAGKIIFSSKTTGCANEHRRFYNVCKRKKDRTTAVAMPYRVDCDPGYQYTKNECHAAALEAGGVGSLHEGQWPETPCGCFLTRESGKIHFSTRTTNCQNWHSPDSWVYNPVCKPRGNRNEYKLDHVKTKCDAGEEIPTKSLCAIAGQALYGRLDSGVVTSGDYPHAPCGCFLDNADHVHWNTRTSSCGNNGLAFMPVCYKFSEGTSDGRDIYGKLKNNDKHGFTTMTYTNVQQKAQSCITEKLANLHAECYDKAGNQQNAKYYECRVKKQEEATNECDRFGPIQIGLELVFGTNTAPGFICGIKDAVVTHGALMPGTCCLDAPYERPGNEWGHPFQCGKVCGNPGPYLAGINKEACDAQGGTWCPTPVNCNVLKTCVADLISQAGAAADNTPAFLQYLDAAPKIADVTDLQQCGRARAYFGFDELFVNDAQICDDIKQLKYTVDFTFLDEFLKQGSPAPGTKSGAPNLQLTPPDRTKSKSPPVKDNKGMKLFLYGLSEAKSGMDYVVSLIDDTECPCDPVCISSNICKVTKAVAKKITRIILKILSKAHDVFANLYDIFSEEPAKVESQENTAVLYENMQMTADYLVGIRNDLNTKCGVRRLEEIADGGSHGIHHNTSSTVSLIKAELKMLKDSVQTMEQSISEMHESMHGSLEAFMAETREALRKEIGIIKASNPSLLPQTMTRDAPVPTFQCEVKVMPDNMKCIIALSTLDGALVEADFAITRIGGSHQKDQVTVVFRRTDLEPGKVVLCIEDEDPVTTTKVVFVRATPVDGSIAQVANKIVSFD
ncbi:expressed unknown protein [Seminavis robusta]|uniref:Uncharacterized protein n=1 Tax=Seminavis robusta TaxID=568900 RepID=A0A9N8H6H7_9STRA|nr:expressed unknown protein [Seminavis robusta]|eukprot:Sro44_g026560.1 n/a (1449) ;mRNA; f:42134-47705